VTGTGCGGAAPGLERVAVVGTSCSGKTTLARRLASSLGSPHVELDALYWGPGWTRVAAPAFRWAVDRATRRPRWVVDGNYTEVRDLVWSRATTVVWVDPPLRVLLRRALPRTLRTAVRREEIVPGSRDSVCRAFLSRESILLWILRSHGPRRRELRKAMAGERHPCRMVALRTPAQLREFLTALPAPRAPGRPSPGLNRPQSPGAAPPGSPPPGRPRTGP